MKCVLIVANRIPYLWKIRRLKVTKKSLGHEIFNRRIFLTDEINADECFWPMNIFDYLNKMSSWEHRKKIICSFVACNNAN